MIEELKKSVISDEIKKKLEKDWGIYLPMYSERNDVVCGLVQLFSTVAIVYDINEFGFEERYCYSNSFRAVSELAAWKEREFNDQRPTGWIACRGLSKADLIKAYGKDYAHDILRVMNDAGCKDNFITDSDIKNISEILDMDIIDVAHKVSFLRMTEQVI